MRRRWVLTIAAAAAILANCGVVYTVPKVRDGAPLGSVPSTAFDVTVVTLDYETAASANLDPYVPPRLPAAFQPGAAAKVAGGGFAAPDLAALPEPSALRTPRPGFEPERFPPIEDPLPYRIGVSDVVLLAVRTPGTVSDLPGLISAQNKRQGYVVQDDGAIAIPDAGRVRIGGMTLPEAESEIFRVLVAAGIDPAFSLEIAEFNSQRVSVGGAVATPTLLPLGLKPVYLHEAVQLAGGPVAPDPALASVQLFRGGETYRIGLTRFLTDPAARQVVLMDGDSVYVATRFREDEAQRYFEEQLQIRASQIAGSQFQFQSEQLRAERERIAEARLEAERALFLKRLELGAVEQPHAYLAGEVLQPQRVPLPFERSANLADVLFANRGMLIRESDYDEIYVIRAARDPARAGQLTAYHLKAGNAVNLAVATQMEIRPNDVVFMAEQPITSWNRVVSQILPTAAGSVLSAATRF